MSWSILSMGAVMKAVRRSTALESSDVMVQTVYGCCDEGGTEEHGVREFRCHGSDCLRVL